MHRCLGWTIAVPPMVLKEPGNERINPMHLSQAGREANHNTSGM